MPCRLILVCWYFKLHLIIGKIHYLCKMKQFFLAADKIKRLIEPMGYCIASDRITVDGGKVGYMYREEGDGPADSGWRFFEGSENQEYADEPSHFGLYDVNTIANYDREIIPLLDSPVGSAFERTSTGLQAVPEGFQAFQRR